MIQSLRYMITCRFFRAFVPGIILVLLFSMNIFVYADPFRTKIAAVVTLSMSDLNGQVVTIGASDAIAIQFADDSVFLRGVEIEIKLPRMTSGSMAWSIYKSITPFPKTDKVSFDGECIISQPVPDRASFVLNIPYGDRGNLKSSPWATVIPSLVKAKEFPIVFKLEQISKGIPPEVESSGFKVRIRPIMTDEGMLKLIVKGRDTQLSETDVEVYLDEKPLLNWAKPLFFKKGNYTIQVRAPGYRDEVRTVFIESAKINEMTILMQDTIPEVILEAPANAIIQFDGVVIDFLKDPQFNVDPGEHTIMCKIGDYTITKKLTAFRGKTYRIVLSVDLEIHEIQ